MALLALSILVLTTQSSGDAALWPADDGNDQHRRVAASAPAARWSAPLPIWWAASSATTTTSSAPVCDGTTDVSSFLDHSIVLPPGICRVTRSIVLTSGYFLRGTGTTIFFDNPTDDLFVAHTALHDVTISDLIINSTAGQRKAGHVINGSFLRSRFASLTVLNQFNGFLIPAYEFVWFSSVLVRYPSSGARYGFYLGQFSSDPSSNPGSEIYLSHVQVYGAEILDRGYVVESTDAVYFTNSGGGGCVSHLLHIFRSPGGHAPNNIFMTNMVSDYTVTGSSTLIQGAINLQISNSWFCSSQVGLELQDVGRLMVSNSQVFNNRATGLLSNNSFGRVTGCFFSAQNVAVRVYTARTNDLSLSLSDNTDGGSTNRSVITDERSNRMIVTGNMWVSGTTFGTPPQVNANNGF